MITPLMLGVISLPASQLLQIQTEAATHMVKGLYMPRNPMVQNQGISVGGKLQVYERVSLTEFPGTETVLDPSNRPRVPVVNAQTS